MLGNEILDDITLHVCIVETAVQLELDQGTKHYYQLACD
jgi:hypothetical protein